MRVKSVMGLKVWSNLGLAKKISKSPYVGLFSVNHTKSNISFGDLSFLVQFSLNLVKNESQLVREPSQVKLGPSSERAKRSLSKSSKSSKSSMFRASEASFASERANRSLRKPSKPSKSSKVRLSEASLPSERANRSLRKPAKAKQTKQTKQLTQIKQINELSKAGQPLRLKRTPRASKPSTVYAS